ncbi:HlyD family efflux transporter periplasmic adaptor subunit [Neobacillus sp. PS3-12]|jgi:multidrug resistance efflux pump|uniref:HlyD family secretion protein n=1 Tax=Neobacillus sp. PS3-12 TaxID=3070677 RepID=UPI0027E1BCA1|nr:HlyD family efflux transporter periplasmic adaptor subunit [Neobacillus sp. PS3-12]WML52944.1 HlyD family efflux transporter periplasmic adaptor subunit [Neobacillus sp. PS3-12]
MNTKRLVLLNVIILIILVGGGFAAFSYYNRTVNYLTTDNAQINGQQVSVAATSNGKLTDWKGSVGSQYSKDDTVGMITTTGADGKPVQVPVTVPTNGTVVQNNGVENAFVAAGTPLAIEYDFNNLWVTANIDETKIDEIAKGQDVDIYVDAFPNQILKGKVQQIGLATAGTFSLLPSTNSTSNYTKVTQVVPVKVSIDDNKGVAIVPGMNVTVRIHK